MSAPHSRAGSTGRLVLTAFLIGLLAAAVFLGNLPTGSSSSWGSATSVEPDGRLALHRLLGEALLGYEPESWREVPAALPRGNHLLLMASVPKDPTAGKGNRGEEDSEASKYSGRRRDLRHYRRFMDSGGTIFVQASNESLTFLEDELQIEDINGIRLNWDYDDVTDGNYSVTVASGEELFPVFESWRTLDLEDAGGRMELLAEDQDGAPMAVRISVGRGACVLLVADVFLANGAIGLRDNALLFVRILEEIEPFERVLLDEYAIGNWDPPSPLKLAFGKRSRLMSWHCVALGLFVLWRASGRRAFARDPQPIALQSALTRAEGFAGLLLSRGRFDLLANFLRGAGEHAGKGTSEDELSALAGTLRSSQADHGEVRPRGVFKR
ncbi:MAG: hypothetical protein ACI8PQ_000909 [Planctomycetota bacterium]